MTRPVVGITMGDPAGIGPEIIVKALGGRRIFRHCRPLLVGQHAVFEAAARSLGSPLRFTPAAPRPLRGGARPLPVTEAGRHVPLRPGRATASGGRASLAAIEAAVGLALAGEVDAVVTAPISKEAIRKAHSPFPGHTEMLASLTGARSYAMMLVGGGLRVSLATIHIPLREVPDALSVEGVTEVISLTWKALASLVGDCGTIGVCGLNPHAGEGTLFGREDREVILPALRRARRRGIRVEGPFPADTIFHRALGGEFSAVVAMYHDQGLGPLKTLAFDRGVNVTLGLPIIRTSVDHGTAFDIAGRGVAKPESLLAAVELAAAMARGASPGAVARA